MPLTEDLLPPRYHELAWIARGGMADVYRAIDEPLDRLVAVKVLSSRFVWDEDVCRRFRREGLAAARLSGDVNTVTIFDVGEWHGRPFIVMEHLGGDRSSRCCVGDLNRSRRSWPGSRRPPRPSTRPMRSESFTATSSQETSCSTTWAT